MSDLQRRVVSTAQQVFLEGISSHLWDTGRSRRRPVLMVTTRLMHVTARLFPKI